MTAGQVLAGLVAAVIIICVLAWVSRNDKSGF